jgi:hypothetical protein
MGPDYESGCSVFKPHFVLHKGIEPLSSGRKPDALTAMLMEQIIRKERWYSPFLSKVFMVSRMRCILAGKSPSFFFPVLQIHFNILFRETAGAEFSVNLL